METCDLCFASVDESFAAEHRAWHEGLADRLSRIEGRLDSGPF